MESIDIENCDVTLNYVIYTKEEFNGRVRKDMCTLSGDKLLSKVENTIECIVYTNAIDSYIQESIKPGFDNQGFDEYHVNYVNAFYDNIEVKEKAFETLIRIFSNQNIEFVLENGYFKTLVGNDDLVTRICAIYNNSLDYIDITKYDYLNDFVNYLTNKNMKKVLKEG